MGFRVWGQPHQGSAWVQVVALSRKVTALRCQGHSMAAGYPCDSHTPCVRLPPLWEGLAAASLHFLSAGADNRWPSHPGAGPLGLSSSCQLYDWETAWTAPVEPS